jgi:hypothetical protein
MKKTILIAAVMFFAFSVAASAQALLQVGSTPVTTVASCGTAELTGDVVFTTATSSQPVITGTITVNYGVPITNIAGLGITVNGGSAVGLVTNISGALTDLPAGRLVLQITPGATNITAIGVTGIRVNIAGNPTLTSLSAIVTATGNAFVGGQTSIVVVSSIASAIASVGTGVPSTALNNISSVSPASSLPGTVQVAITEGFLNAWVPNSIVGVTFSAPPAGITLTVPATINATGGTNPAGFTFSTATGGAAAPAPITSLTAAAGLTVYYKLTTLGATSPVTSETLTVPVGVALSVGAVLPLPQSTASVTAVDMYPKLGAFPDFAGSVIPQYSGTTCQKGPVQILAIIAANTNLLIPYATTAAGYDTGLAIANTTTDPFTGTNSAVKQNGSITFVFYPQTGTSFTYTTGATSPGEGLTAGVLNTGGLYTVLLSRLLTAASAPAAFSGYIVVTVNATNAHGQYFISDFSSFTNGALMPVLDPALRRTAPEKLAF